jgi:gliding motility-associated-like protein
LITSYLNKKAQPYRMSSLFYRTKLVVIASLLIVLLCYQSNIYGQSVSLFDISSDSICIDDSLIIEEAVEADSYYWNFCSGNLAYNPEGENFDNSGTLNGPAFIDFEEDNNNYFAFISNHDGTLTRNSYGSNRLSEPTSENLGNFGGAIPNHAQGLQVVNDASSWYVFIVGGQREKSRLVRLDFGTSLSNTPTAHYWDTLGNIDYPIDLYITRAGSYIGYTVSKNNNTLTRFEFKNGLNNKPVATNLGNVGNFNGPCGIFPVKNYGNWYMFVTNYDGNEITRLDFGNSLTSIPTATNIGNSSYLHYPFDLTLIQDCERIYGFVLNRFNDIVRLDFTNGYESEPEFTSLGDLGYLYNPQGISDVFRIGDTLYTFVANMDNSTITRLYFPGCANASPSSSTERYPPGIKYNAPGIYNINLVINEGQTDEEHFCRDIIVLGSPKFTLGNDTIIPAGETVELSPDTSFTAYSWSTGSFDKTIEVGEPGTYFLTAINEYGCRNTDDIEVFIDVGIPNFFTPNGDGFNDTWYIPFLFSEPETEIFIYDRFGNSVIQYKAGDNEWDGTVDGRKMPEGTYWYVIKIPGQNKPFKGPVTIKR